MSERPKKQASRRGRYIAYGLIALFVLPFAYVMWFRGQEFSGSNESFAVASEKCWRIKELIPPQAANINFQCQTYYPNLHACFVLSQENFQAWAAKQKWSLKALTPESGGATIKDWKDRGLKNQRKEIIQTGFAANHEIINESFSKKMPWQVWVVLYDSEHETVYLKITTMD